MGLMFLGPIPDWMDPEREGWLFDQAATVFGSPALSDHIERVNLGRPPEEARIVFQPGMDPVPAVAKVWWPERERHTPYLVHLLLRGTVRAFGDADRAGRWPEWIQPRAWRDLQRDPDNARLFVGGGGAFWNVRVMDAAAFEGRTASVEADAAPRKKGGRPRRSDMDTFVRELLRVADKPDGLPDSSALRRQMIEWSEQQEPEGPSSTTISEWLALFDYRNSPRR